VPDLGPLLPAIAAPLLAIASGFVGLRLASKLGVGPVQAQYVALLKGMTDAQQERIEQLETENGDLRKRVGTIEKERDGDRRDFERRERALRKQLSDLRTELHILRDEIAEGRKR
jgi:predicted  nucleic acid-binding Zn-ribbon protein